MPGIVTGGTGRFGDPSAKFLTLFSSREPLVTKRQSTCVLYKCMCHREMLKTIVGMTPCRLACGACGELPQAAISLGPYSLL
jgi:hypothetical protein